MKLATYLFKRLQQLGVESIHGVPGDFNLTLLDHVEPAGLRWVGSANELNAAYAADGYSRIKGVGAVVTTFGVGELSAINAIAGAYAERAAVVHIVGIPARPMQDDRILVHHTMKDGDFTKFAQAHALFTVAQTRLWDPRTCADQIDETLRQCLHHNRPVYIEVPVDLVSAPIPEARFAQPLQLVQPEPLKSQDAVVKRILDKMYSAKQPVILIDGETRGMGSVKDVQKLSEATGWPTFATCYGKGLLNETLPNFHGIYKGAYDEESVQSFFKDSDLVVCFGPHYSTTNSFASTAVPNPETTISFSYTEIKIGKETIRDAPGKFLISKVAENIDSAKAKACYKSYPTLPRDFAIPYSDLPLDEPVAQDRLWHVIGNILRPGDILMGETGTSAYGVRSTPLPQNTRLFTSVTWLSIGYMLPAAQGAALAQQELVKASKYHDVKEPRTILFIGDGSFQMTAQELATIIRHNLNLVVVLVNNNGYTIERAIHGMAQGYNDVSPWRYLKAPSFFGAKEDTYTATIKTYRDLQQVFTNDKLTDGEGLRMVELFLHQDDCPKGPLTQFINAQKAGQGIMQEKEE